MLIGLTKVNGQFVKVNIEHIVGVKHNYSDTLKVSGTITVETATKQQGQAMLVTDSMDSIRGKLLLNSDMFVEFQGADGLPILINKKYVVSLREEKVADVLTFIELFTAVNENQLVYVVVGRLDEVGEKLGMTTIIDPYDNEDNSDLDLDYYKKMFSNKSDLLRMDIADIYSAGRSLIEEIERLMKSK